MRSRRVDGMDPELVYDEVAEAVGIARGGGGPTLIEALTYRHLGHSKSDKRVYRTADEETYWIERDPVARWCARLRAAGVPRRQLDELTARAREEIEQAVAAAATAPDPDPAHAAEGVYA